MQSETIAQNGEELITRTTERITYLTPKKIYVYPHRFRKKEYGRIWDMIKENDERAEAIFLFEYDTVRKEDITVEALLEAFEQVTERVDELEGKGEDVDIRLVLMGYSPLVALMLHVVSGLNEPSLAFDFKPVYFSIKKLGKEMDYEELEVSL